MTGLMKCEVEVNERYLVRIDGAFTNLEVVILEFSPSKDLVKFLFVNTQQVEWLAVHRVIVVEHLLPVSGTISFAPIG